MGKEYGAIRMPLVGCLAVSGVFIALFVLLVIVGYAKVRSANTVSSPLRPGSPTGQGQPPLQRATPSGSPSAPSPLPFTPPEGYVVRPVRSELPCGATVEAYLVVPAYASPCGQ
jgi:hypothetical protein